MPSSRIVLAAVAAWALVAPGAGRAEVDRDTFRSTAWSVVMQVPPDWDLSEQSSYPSILVSGVHRRGGGRLTLAAQRVDAAETVRGYSQRNRDTLEKVGFHIERLAPHPTGAFILDAETPDRRRRIRQGYKVEGGVALILTLAAPADAMGTYRRAFDDTLRNLLVTRHAPAGPASAPAPAPAATATAANPDAAPQ